MNQTFVCCTTYHIYLSILEAYKYKKLGYKSRLVFITDKIEDGEQLLPKLNKIDAFEAVVPIKAYSIIVDLKNKIGFFDYVFNRAKALKMRIEANNPQLLANKDFFLNSELNLFEINRSRAYFIIKYPDNFMRMHEDGLSAYERKLSKTRIFNRKYITRFPLLKGHDEQVKEFLVQYPEKVFDEVLKDKVKKLDIEALENGLTKTEKLNVVNAFLDHNLNLVNEKKALIITQPLSEMDLMSENKKIDIYKSMVEDANKQDYKVYLKTHPREKTDYYKIFGDSLILMPRLFPLEIFNLSEDFNFEIGYTYHSSALGHLKYCNQKVFYHEQASEVYK
ncbi:glycosyltransferase family 52 [uncultured Winogradskyella sp.]|uniref:glycosyltransferase family 52 n=1 Tax=uncultured Winogradskyella sp. TaxID=395353 RepID=UPI002625C4D2|nr:glycosyltransferase family 52 [uncultured Winogradskyella sp.]